MIVDLDIMTVFQIYPKIQGISFFNKRLTFDIYDKVLRLINSFAYDLS